MREQGVPVLGGRGEDQHRMASGGDRSKCLPKLRFSWFGFDRKTQKYYHARLMSAPAVIDSLEFARAEQVAKRLAVENGLLLIPGSYFGAAQGVILMAVLAILVVDDLQRLNGLKNLIAAVTNGVAAILFIVFAPVAWPPAILIAIGSTIGGQLGAVVGRRLSPFALRSAIIVVGSVVAVKLLIG